MKNLDIKYVFAQNFLCFGSDPIEINFSDYGNIILVRGSNHDVMDSDSRTASNGVGKSSIPEIIVYTLFGKTIKHPKKINHKDVINNKIGKGLKTEVRLGNLRVQRTRKPDSLRVWESEDGVWDDSTEITLGGQPATQNLLEDKIGLNYETFVNVVVFTDNNSGSFLESDAASKREIVENLLSLEKYKNFAEQAKNLKKEKKDAIKLAQNDYESLRKQLEQAVSRAEAAREQEKKWKEQKAKEIEDLVGKVSDLKKKLEKSDGGSDFNRYQEAQEKIEQLNAEIPDLEQRQTKIQEAIGVAQEKFDANRRNQSDVQLQISELNSKIKDLSSKVLENDKEIKRLENDEGATCKYCMGVVSKDNYEKYTKKLTDNTRSLEKNIDSFKSEKDNHSDRLKSLQSTAKKISEAVSVAKESLSKVSKGLSDKRGQLSELNKVKKPQSDDVTIQLIKQQIETVLQQIKDKKSELAEEGPFYSIINSLATEIETRKEELEEKTEQLDSLEKELPYYEFWSVAFGDSGIRKFIIDGIIPALNSRVAYWLQFLIDGKIILEFNNELEEKIERSPSDGDPFVYYAMSGGERRRLNLAVSQAFAHVMMLSSGTCPSVVFLDEVTTNIDQIGVVGVYNMISELSKDRQVFITTHDQNLLEMLEGCELIDLEKKNGFTRMKK